MLSYRNVFVALSLMVLGVSQASAVPVGNDYICDKVKDWKTPKFVSVDVSGVDEVGPYSCTAKRPFLLCHPASIDGGGIVDPSLNQCCYKVKCDQMYRQDFFTIDAFGTLLLEMKKPFVICRPCDAVPG